MLVLKVDSSERKNNKVQLLKRGRRKDKVLDEIAGDIDIVVSISELLEKNSLTLQDVESLEYNRGPGSFTGLKNGSAIINTLNWALGRISSNEVIMPEYGKEPNIQK